MHSLLDVDVLLDGLPGHGRGVDVSEPVGHALLDLQVEHAVLLHKPAKYREMASEIANAIFDNQSELVFF